MRKEALIIQNNQKYVFICTLFTLISLSEAFNLSTSIAETKWHSSNKKKTIVLDPGHGSHDCGAIGVSGITEKDVTLSLSKLIADEIKNKYTVILTRTDDYSIDLCERAAIANHNKADIFISLHVNGSFILNKKGATITYYKKFTETKNRSNFMSEKSDIILQNQWEDIQTNHTPLSRELAQAVTNELKRNINVTTYNTPVYVLSGANMPAVLIEIGYLTNPSEEKSLKNTKYLKEIAYDICLAIDFFLK